MILFAFLFYNELYFLLPIAIFFLFVSIINVTHDLVHNTLGFSKSVNEFLIFITGILILESGNSYQFSHHLHHQHFPKEIDEEGKPAKNGLLRAILIGPLYIPKLFIWSYQNVLKEQKKWLKIELLCFLIIGIIALLTIQTYPIVLVYFILVNIGGWFYPLLTVYLPHRKYNGTALGNTICYRGKLADKLFMNLIYHLEHHLYPQVPTHNLDKLAHRLEPYLIENQDQIVFKKMI